MERGQEGLLVLLDHEPNEWSTFDQLRIVSENPAECSRERIHLA